MDDEKILPFKKPEQCSADNINQGAETPKNHFLVIRVLSDVREDLHLRARLHEMLIKDMDEIRDLYKGRQLDDAQAGQQAQKIAERYVGELLLYAYHQALNFRE